MLNLWIMQGLPGSGKSFHAKNIGFRKEIVSADDYPGLYTPAGYQRNLAGKAHADCFKRTMDFLRYGVDVVVDNTNSTAIEVAPYVLLGQALGAETTLVTVIADPEIAFKRQTHNVPEATFQRMLYNLRNFSAPPYWPIEFSTINS